MIRKASVLVLVLCLFLALSSAGSVQAQSGLAILDSSAKVDFPSELSFNLLVESNVNITDIRLYYVVERMSPAEVTSEVYFEFAPDNLIEAEWTWDVRKIGGLPPGANLAYWWTVEDASGDVVETAPVQVQFDDNRYSWNSLAEGEVTLYWYKGGQSFAQELMAAAQQALDRLTKDTGARLEKPVRIYIYASPQDLRGGMIYPQEWTGGVAFTRYGIIAIGIDPSDLQWGRRVIAHELAHLVIHQMTFNPYSDLPTWLDEGLAMYAEGTLEPEYRALLNGVIARGSLISVRSLSSPFSAYALEAALSYAQSYSLVEFLISNYERGKMLELLYTFREGSSYDDAVEKVYGFDMDGLDTLWRDYVTRAAKPVEEKGMHPALIWILAVLAAGLLLGLGLFIRSRAWRRGS